MATRTLAQSTSEARLIVLAVLGFWPAYMIGALYVTGSIIGWLILGVTMIRAFVDGKNSLLPVPYIVIVWIAGMLMMELALLIGHANWSLGLLTTIKSSIGWAKGWALIAIFIGLGAVVSFRIEALIRAVCITSTMAIVFFLLSIFAFKVGAPEVLFTSPLKIIGGPGYEFFEFRLYGINPENGNPRWFFFTPWAPAAGLVSCLFAIICYEERHRTWRLLGILGCVVICVASQSRAGLAIMFIVLPILFIYRDINFGVLLIMFGIIVVLVALPGYTLIESTLDVLHNVKNSRPDSTRVRSTLAEIAIQRWQQEAPIWGHGIVEPGAKIVEHMPIGTHHSWYGLLFTKGIVGAAALAAPLMLTLIYLAIVSIRNSLAIPALGITIVLSIYSFFENLEILVYLYWPALLYLGYSLRMPILQTCHNER